MKTDTALDLVVLHFLIVDESGLQPVVVISLSSTSSTIKLPDHLMQCKKCAI